MTWKIASTLVALVLLLGVAAGQGLDELENDYVDLNETEVEETVEDVAGEVAKSTEEELNETIQSLESTQPGISDLQEARIEIRRLRNTVERQERKIERQENRIESLETQLEEQRAEDVSAEPNSQVKESPPVPGEGIPAKNAPNEEGNSGDAPEGGNQNARERRPGFVSQLIGGIFG